MLVRMRSVNTGVAVQAGSVVVLINVVAARGDDDLRSPMQLAAELVMMAKREGSALRQRPALVNVKEVRRA